MVVESIKKAGIVFAAGVSFGAAGALFYFLLKRDESMLKYEEQIIKSTKHCTAEVEIPRDIIGAFIGRQGSNIKLLQEETKTRINFREFDDDDDNPTRTAIIRGASEDVKKAKEKICDYIVNQPQVVTEEIHVPQNACGMIIGRNGDNIREMCRVTKAKITIERSSGTGDSDSLRLVTIRGQPEQIDLAKILIHEKLIEAEERYRKDVQNDQENNKFNGVTEAKVNTVEIKRQLALTAPLKDDQNVFEDDDMHERLMATGSDGFSEVYLSAAANPSKFWIQIIGVRSTDLDKMIESMTSFYSNEENKNTHSLSSTNSTTEVPNIKVGDILAAPFAHDKSWYRVEVMDIMYDDYDPSFCSLESYYVDFGDTGILSINDVCVLKREYMKLPFQAIECCLNGVKPVTGSDWPEEVTDVFEELTYVAQWKVIMAKPINIVLENGRKIQMVELVDTNSEKDVNVAEELIQKQLASRVH